MLHRTVAVVAVGVLVALGGSAAHADAYKDGKKAYKAKNYSQAVAKFKKALQDRPTQAKVRWRLALAYLKLGDGRSALRWLKQARSMDSSLSFTDKAKFTSKYQKALSMAGGSAATGSTATGVGGSAARMFKYDFLNNAAVAMMRNTSLVRDFSGKLKSSDLAGVRGVVNAARSRGIRMRVVFLPSGNSRGLGRFLNRTFNFIKGTTRDALIAGSPKAINAKAGFIRRADMQRVLQRNAGQFMISYGNGLRQLASDIHQIGARKLGRATARVASVVQRRKSRKKIWLWILIGVGGLIVLGIIIAVVRARQRRAEEEAEYKEAYHEALNLVDPVAEKLSGLQLSIQIVDDEDAEMLTRRAEQNYFGAQGLLNKIPSPGKGEPDLAGVRRLLGMLHEANEALEKADRICSRKLDGKPVNKEKILEQGGKKLGCFFCSRPMRDESSGKVTPIVLKGKKMDVLLCHPCHDDYKRGAQPKVRMVEYQGNNVHWTMVPDYDPWYDYYHYDRYHATWVDVMVMSAIFDWALWDHYHSPYMVWYEPGYYTYDYDPVYYDIDSYAVDHDVDAVIGSAWSDEAAPPGVDFGGSDYGDGFSGGGDDFSGGGDDFGGSDESDFASGGGSDIS